MIIKTFSLGPLCANCYYVEEQSEAVIIDPGFPDALFLDFIEKNAEKVKYILLTHAHFDHIMAILEVKKLTNADIVVFKDDEPGLRNPKVNLSGCFGRQFEEFSTDLFADIIISENGVLNFGNGNIEIIHTPGHSMGSVCFKIGDLLFTGDTLFAGSVGRTDFPGSDRKKMGQSLKLLANLSDDLEIYPGHGEKSTIGIEKITNPYLAF